MSSHLEFVHVTAASMESINSDINKSPPPPEDYALSDGEIAEDDHGTNESTPTAVNTSSAMSSSGDGLPKLPDGANTGTLASILSSILSRNSAEGVPRTWRPDLKPMLRYAVEGSDGKCQVKYLTWDQSKGEDIRMSRLSGHFFNSDEYCACEPLWLRGGDWNHATISFFGHYDDDDVWEVVHNTFGYENITLPTLSEKVVWAEKPSVEWVDLTFLDVKLRGTFGVGTNPHRGRLRVVTHKQFENGDLEMVMKIWPTPMSSQIGLENEMMVYGACDGTGITPEFVGYVKEQGRVIGMLTKYHGKAHKPKSGDEKELCRTALHTFQTLTGWQRKPRANHKDNYLIEDGKALLIDLASVYPPEEVSKKGNEWTQKLLHEDFDSYWDHDKRIRG